MDTYRVWAEIDLDALTHNLSVIRARAGAGVRLMLVVKADAYGHGAVAVAHHAVRCGIAALGVGTSAEALELRLAGLRVPILVLGTILEEESVAMLRHGIEIGIHASDRIQKLEGLAARMGLRARVHLNIDTGMGRLGVLPGSALRLLEEIEAAPHLLLAGIMTHISSPSGSLHPGTNAQVRAFDRVLAEAEAHGLRCGWTHLANSAALFTGLGRRYDTVRPGISAYGVLPRELPGARELSPVMSLRSTVVFLKDLPAGSAVGYGSKWVASRQSRIATLPLGYNDGLPYRLGERGDVLLRGRRAPIVGRVSMDYTTVDVTGVPDVRVGDTATIIGSDGEETIGVEEVARKVETIPYEITCAVGKRVQRLPVGGEELVLPSQAAAEGEADPDSASPSSPDNLRVDPCTATSDPA